MINVDNDHESHLSSRVDVARVEVKRLFPDLYVAGKRLAHECKGDKPLEIRVASLWVCLQVALRVASGSMGNASRWYKS